MVDQNYEYLTNAMLLFVLWWLPEALHEKTDTV